MGLSSSCFLTRGDMPLVTQAEFSVCWWLLVAFQSPFGLPFAVFLITQLIQAQRAYQDPGKEP